MYRKIFFIILLLVFSFVLYSEDFNRLNISTYVIKNINTFDKSWNNPKGIGFDISTNYRKINFIVDLFYTDFQKKTSVPDFKITSIALGIGKEKIQIYKNFYMKSYLLIGNNLMKFEKEQTPGINYESEIGISYKFAMSYAISQKFSINLNFFEQRIFTRKRILLNWFGLSFSYEIVTPEFIQSFLR